VKIKKRFIVVALFVGLVYYFVDDYQHKMVRVSSTRLYLPVVKVKEIVMKIPRVNGHYLNWKATVKLKNDRLVSVVVAHSPVPKVGDCMPVIVTEFERGGIAAVLSVDAWQMGAYFAAENQCGRG